jgi:DNA-directed RNA polymerase specialized sigma24 family protein
MDYDDSSGEIEESSSSSSFYGEFQGTDAEFDKLFTRIVTDFRADLEEALFVRGATRAESEEIVQDFFVKLVQKRTAFARLNHWIYLSRTPQRAFGFIKTCVLHHLIDSRRKTRAEPFMTELRESNPHVQTSFPGKIDPLDYAWAVSVLQVAVHDLRAELLGDRSDAEEAGRPSRDRQDRDSRLLTWQVFVERFISPAVKHVVRGRKFTAAEIAARLGISRDQVLYRAQQVRDLLARHLRQALADSCPDTDPEVLFQELQATLVLGNASLPDLLAALPDFFAESTVDTLNVFSLASSDELPGDAVIDLLVPPTPSSSDHETKKIWNLLMRREYQTHPGSQSSTNRSRYASVEEIIFSPLPSVHDLQTIKKLARYNGQREHKLLQEIYHALYALAIARAKNILNRTITSSPPELRVHSLGYAARYSWLPDVVSRELELAIRKFSDPNDQSSLAP